MTRTRVLWICGPSGAGKTTLANSLIIRIKRREQSVVFLDGDNVRLAFNHDLGYDAASRRAQISRVSSIARTLVGQVDWVVIATVQFSDSESRRIAEIGGCLTSVAVTADLGHLQSRNSKGLYESAPSRGNENVVGIDLELEAPERPDLVLNSGDLSETEMVDKLEAVLFEG